MTKEIKEKHQDETSDLENTPATTQEMETSEEAGDLEKEEEILELMGFKLGSEEYAIDIMSIKEITPLFDMTPIPRAPVYILGIISLRGSIVPVFDAKKKMGLPDTETTEKARIIVLTNKDEQVAILVDAITSAVTIPARSIEPSPPVLKGVEAEFIGGVGRYMDRMIIIMNIDEIIKMEEFAE
jgi:purine-binding chemotaxis protein CheW